MPQPATLYNLRKWQLIGKSQWCGSAMLQLQHTPPPQSTTPCLHPVSIHQMAPPVWGSKHPITAYYLVYQPRKDERLSRPGCLVTYRNKVPPPGVEPGHVTHPSTWRARRRVTSLIRPTPLPLCHAVNRRRQPSYYRKTINNWLNIHKEHSTVIDRQPLNTLLWHVLIGLSIGSALGFTSRMHTLVN